MESSLFKLNKETNSEIEKISIFLQDIECTRGFGWSYILYNVKSYENLIEKINRYKISNLERPLFDIEKEKENLHDGSLSDSIMGRIVQSKDIYYISKHNLFNILVVIDLK